MQKTSKTVFEIKHGYPLVLMTTAFMLLTSATMMIAIGYYSSERLQKTMYNLHIEEIDNGLATFDALLDSYFDSRITQLRDYAAVPLVTQGVMQPERLGPAIVDYFDNLKLFGEQIPMLLVDFAGETVHKTINTPSTLTPERETIEQLINGTKSKVISIVQLNGGYHWQLAVPITYEGVIEGVLLAYLAMDQINVLIKIEQQLIDAELQIHSGNQLIYRSGSKTVESQSKSIDVPTLGVQLEYRVANSDSQLAVNQLRYELFTIYIITITIFLLTILTFIRVFLLKQLSIFKKFANGLVEHRAPKPLNERSIIRELAHINHHLNRAAHRAYKEYCSLKQLNDTLESRVSERTDELVAANRKLEILSEIDPLTQLANRRRLERHLDSEIRRAYRTGSELSVLMIDVDHFKSYNDSYGHSKGDECLTQIATALSTELQRPGDLVARIGGEEFFVVLPKTNAMSVLYMAEQLRTAVEELNIPHAGSEGSGRVTISTGAYTSKAIDGSFTSEHFKEEADRQLYRAKESGRNCVMSDSPGIVRNDLIKCTNRITGM